MSHVMLEVLENLIFHQDFSVGCPGDLSRSCSSQTPITMAQALHGVAYLPLGLQPYPQVRSWHPPQPPRPRVLTLVGAKGGSCRHL